MVATEACLRRACRRGDPEPAGQRSEAVGAGDDLDRDVLTVPARAGRRPRRGGVAARDLDRGARRRWVMPGAGHGCRSRSRAASGPLAAARGRRPGPRHGRRRDGHAGTRSRPRKNCPVATTMVVAGPATTGRPSTVTVAARRRDRRSRSGGGPDDDACSPRARSAVAEARAHPAAPRGPRVAAASSPTARARSESGDGRKRTSDARCAATAAARSASPPDTSTSGAAVPAPPLLAGPDHAQAPARVDRARRRDHAAQARVGRRVGGRGGLGDRARRRRSGAAGRSSASRCGRSRRRSSPRRRGRRRARRRAPRRGPRR